MPPRRCAAANKALSIIELLELVLIHLDQRTLLLFQRVATKWRGVIQTNRKMQKKLFFIQPTVEEALDLELISASSIVFSPHPQSVALMNPLVIKIVELSSAEHRGYPRARIPVSVALEQKNGEHGSWERMYQRTQTTPMESLPAHAFRVEVRVNEVVDRAGAWGRYREPPQKGDVVDVRCSHEWSGGPVRVWAKKVETHVLGLMEWGLIGRVRD